MRRELDGPFLAVHVRAVTLVDEPVVAPVNPDVELVLLDDLDDRLDHVLPEHVFGDDGEIGFDEQAAVERGDGRRDRQRFDEHLHPARRPPAGDGELDPGVAHFFDGLLARVGEDFFLGDEGAVHVGEQQAGATGCGMFRDRDHASM